VAQGVLFFFRLGWLTGGLDRKVVRDGLGRNHAERVVSELPVFTFSRSDSLDMTLFKMAAHISTAEP